MDFLSIPTIAKILINHLDLNEFLILRRLSKQYMGAFEALKVHYEANVRISNEGAIDVLAGFPNIILANSLEISRKKAALFNGAKSIHFGTNKGALHALGGITIGSIETYFHLQDEDIICLSGVRNLNLSRSSTLTDAPLIEHIRGALSVSICACPMLTDAALVCARGAQIVELAGTHDGQFTDLGIENLEGALDVTLWRCGVTDAGLKHLKWAQDVALDSCPLITAKGLFNALVCVRTLRIRLCNNVDKQECLELFKGRSVNLKFLHQ